MLYGWVTKFYIKPSFFFKFYGFEWVEPMPAMGIYALFGVLWLCAVCIIAGAFYRIATILFFVGFTYAELLDMTHYLNHYYLMCVLCFVQIWLPAHRAYSVDAWLRPASRVSTASAAYLYALRAQLAIVYFFAGVAKLQTDWLLDAQPLTLWLARHSNFPIVGGLLAMPFTAYFFAWFGCLYDLTIWLWLSMKRTRVLAYITVVAFHVLTGLLFNIGVFPFMMMGVTLLFFNSDAHKNWIRRLFGIFILTLSKLKLFATFATSNPTAHAAMQMPQRLILAGVLVLQCLIPLRFLLYKSDVLWAEEGFRFSWRVMVIEKTGQAIFTVHDGASERSSLVNNLQYITEKQELMMATQADLIVQFAHFLANEYATRHGYQNPRVTVESFVSLNGRRSQRFVSDTVDLAGVYPDLSPQTYILPSPR